MKFNPNKPKKGELKQEEKKHNPNKNKNVNNFRTQSSCLFLQF